MKTNIVKIAMTLALGVMLTSFVHGATNQLGKVNNTSYIVTREDDPKFQAWKTTDNFRWPSSGTRGTFKLYPENGIKGFFINNVSLYDILRGGTNGLLSAEVDPLFTKWSRTNTYVKAESDPQFNAWVSTFKEIDPLFDEWTKTNTYVKVEEDPLFNAWKDNFSEADPLFYGWLGGETIEFTNATPATVKIGNTTVESLLDGKLDATNGVAYG